MSVLPWEKSVSLCPASFCTPKPNLRIIADISWLPRFAFQSPWWKRHLFLVLVLGSLVGLHRIIQLQLLQHYWLVHSLVAQMVKRLPAVLETQIQSLGWEDPLEKEMATHSSILACRIPWTEKPDGLQSMGSKRVKNSWATSVSSLDLEPANCQAPSSRGADEVVSEILFHLWDDLF